MNKRLQPSNYYYNGDAFQTGRFLFISGENRTGELDFQMILGDFYLEWS